MALYDPATITQLTDLLGAIELQIDNMIDKSFNGSIMDNMTDARKLAYDQGMTLNSVEFDRIRELSESMRLNETTIVRTFQDSLSLSIGAIDNYFIQTFNSGMREYYDGSDVNHTVSWDDMFRQLWRREMNQELIIQLATATKTAGVWNTSVVSPGIELPSGLEVRVGPTVGPASITLTMGLTTEARGNISAGMSVAANTASGTVIPITHGVLSQFTDLRTLDVFDGTNGDELSIWVSV